jgi:hypothetical protein
MIQIFYNITILIFDDVGLFYPGAEEGPKGWVVHPLKEYMIWV